MEIDTTYNVVHIYTFLLGLVLTLLFLVFIVTTKRKSSSSRARLPPGSMGWPYIGETTQLYSQDPNIFFTTRQKRYGEIFKSRILGYPCVMLASPEAARFVLVSEAHLFKPTFPRSKEKLIGPSALFFHQGEFHERLRKLVKGSLSPETIQNIVPDIQAIFISFMDSFHGGRLVNTYEEMKKVSFEVGILSIFGHLEDYRKQELYRNYIIVNKGYNSFPTNLPEPYSEKPYRYSARKRLTKILREIILERKEKRVIEKNILSALLNSKDEEGRSSINEEHIADNIIGVLFAAQDTTASVMTWIIKYLHDNPKILQTVKDEQTTIVESKYKQDYCQLTWNMTRNMPITTKMVLESLRMASIISFTFREAVTDVVYNGCLIPKGWKVLPLFRIIHHNPEFFTEPHNFDPSRFEVPPKPNTFMPFGSGVHSCPGNELAKLEILIMIHHLVTNFRWEIVGSQDDGIEYGPFPIPRNGLPTKFWKQ